MPSYSVTDLRNIALVGHAHAGKTSLIEALLQRQSATGGDKAPALPGLPGLPGVCDYEPEEKEHQHSLKSCVVSLDHQGRHINLIDTPGLPDFMGPALGALPAVETVAVVINAQHGVEMVTRRMMEMAKERKLCRMIIVNKIDADNVNFGSLMAQIQESFGAECLPINLPAGGATKVEDVFDHESGESDFSSVAEAHGAIIDQVIEVDEELMAKYLEGGQKVSHGELHAPFEKSLRDGHLVPVCFVSARTGAGVQELLEIMADLMPNPTEGNPRPFIHGEGENTEPLLYGPHPDKHVIAHVWKVTSDPFVGKLSIFRIHQGTISKDTPLYIGDARKPFKVGHLFKVHGKDHKEIDAGIPGDICAVAKVEEIHFNDVLHDSPAHGHVHLAPMVFPMPMAGLAISCKSRGDETKLGKALTALTAEDPCMKVERNSSTHETVLRGLGDLHLRVALEKMRHRYHVDVETAPPKIAYRESITSKADGHHRHKKQTGGAGQFGEVFLRVEPLDRGSGFEFVNEVFGGAIPGQFLPAIEKGVRQVLETGAIAGHPMHDVRVAITDGKYHPVDSKEVAFVAAGKKAFIDAVHKARPVLLEPIVDLDITVPEHNMGDIAGDLSAKRGRIHGTDTVPGGMIVIKAQAPLAELGQYPSQLKSVTGGQGSFTMQLSHYDPVPPHVQQQLVGAYKPHAEDD